MFLVPEAPKINNQSNFELEFQNVKLCLNIQREPFEFHLASVKSYFIRAHSFYELRSFQVFQYVSQNWQVY